MPSSNRTGRDIQSIGEKNVVDESHEAGRVGEGCGLVANSVGCHTELERAPCD